MSQHSTPLPTRVLTTLSLGALLLTAGCVGSALSSGPDSGGPLQAAPSSTAEPNYSANEFPDLMIPGDLDWDREKSMIVRTDSFAGGVLQYSGRVEITSAADFFINTMGRNGWRLAGTTKYKNILLAFTKPNKTCTIMVSEDKILFKTVVNIYIAEDIAGARGGQGSSRPFGL
ncbi:MAG: hypothetical protein ACOY3Z_07480 [Thermodesulfobacteriota bacterium]